MTLNRKMMIAMRREGKLQLHVYTFADANKLADGCVGMIRRRKRMMTRRRRRGHRRSEVGRLICRRTSPLSDLPPHVETTSVPSTERGGQGPRVMRTIVSASMLQGVSLGGQCQNLPRETTLNGSCIDLRYTFGWRS